MSKRVKKEATSSRQKKRKNESLTSPVKSTSKTQLPLKTILHTFLSLATKESEKKKPPALKDMLYQDQSIYHLDDTVIVDVTTIVDAGQEDVLVDLDVEPDVVALEVVQLARGEDVEEDFFDDDEEVDLVKVELKVLGPDHDLVMDG